MQSPRRAVRTFLQMVPLGGVYALFTPFVFSGAIGDRPCTLAHQRY
jgi:hypothetical protein